MRADTSAHGDELHPEPVAASRRPADCADRLVRLLLDEPWTGVARALHVVEVVGRVAGEMRLDRVPGEPLRRVLCTAAAGGDEGVGSTTTGTVTLVALGNTPLAITTE